MTAGQYAAQVAQAGRDLGVSDRGIVIAFATVFVESNWVMYANQRDPESLTFPHQALSNDYNSVGLFQQRAEWWGTVADRMDAYRSAVLFFNSLKRYDYNNPDKTPGFWAQKVQGSAFPDRYDKRVAEAEALLRSLSVVDKESMTEKRLDYDRNIVPQETGWWCGPAATQIVLASRGINLQERRIAEQIEQLENPGRGDDRDGTDYVGLIQTFLNGQVPEAKYTSVYMPKDPPTKAQKDKLWADLKSTIDAGWGMIANFVAPPRNYPRGVKGSVGPAYGGGTVYHYVAAMGYDDDPRNRAVWIADSGFRPFGYWISFDQFATLIPPKGYAYSQAAPLKATQAPTPPPIIAPTLNELTVKVEKLTAALSALLALIEKSNPEIIRAYLEATKGTA